MNKDDLLKLVKSILEKFQNKELQEQRAFIEEANKAEDINDFLFKDHPDALRWYKFINTKKENNWYSSKEAEELYNSADTFAKKSMFVIHWFESFSDIKKDSIESKLASLYANIVGRLNLKYSDFVTPDSLFGSILKNVFDKYGHITETYVKDGDKYCEKGCEYLCKKLIITLHQLDGTPIESESISLGYTIVMPNPDDYQFKSENKAVYEYLQALIIGFYNCSPQRHRSHFDLAESFDLPMYIMHALVEDIVIESIPGYSERYYFSKTAKKEYFKDMNDAERSFYAIETGVVHAYFKANYKLDFSAKPKFHISKYLSTKFLEEKAFKEQYKKVQTNYKTHKLHLASIIGLVLGLIFAVVGSIPLQLLSGGIIIAGIMGTFYYSNACKESDAFLNAFYNNLKTAIDEVKEYSESIYENDIDKVDNESEYIDSIKQFSKTYKHSYRLYKEREARADKMYFENPQQFSQYIHRIDEESIKNMSFHEWLQIEKKKVNAEFEQ